MKKQDKKILYNDARLIPLKNFVQISETGNLKYLQPYENQDPPELSENEKKEAEKYWQRILAQIKDLDVTLPALYLDFILKSREYELYILEKRISKLKNKIGKKAKINNKKLYPLERAFKDYLTYLNTHYVDFQVDEVQPIDNFKERFVKITGIKDKDLAPLFDIKAWYLLDEYKFFVKKLPEKYHNILLTNDFIATFFRVHKIKIDNLNVINDYLSEIYKQNNEYEKWLIVRASYFDLNNLVFSLPKTQKKQDIFDEIVRIEHITGTRIDFESDTLAKFIAQRQLANEIIKNREKQNKKR